MPNTSRTSLISGGHRGAEAEFGRCAKRWGIDQTTLSFEGHAMEWPVGVKVLGEAELAPYPSNRARTSRTKSMSFSVWSAETWKRMVSSPLGTTGKLRPVARTPCFNR